MPRAPINYSTACIYQICCKDVEIKDVYVGSTTNLIERRRGHKVACTNESDKGHNLPVYRFIRDYGGWDNWEVIKVQDADCACREDLLKIERSMMVQLGATLNKQVPGRSVKEYYEAHKAEISEQKKNYYEANKTEILEKKKLYREANRTEITEQRKNYYQAHKTEIAEKVKEYREAHKSEIAEKTREKVTCICGSVVGQYSMKRHCRSKKHQAYLGSLE